jgi:cytochrome c-type biogenesis protein CcmE
MKPLAILVAVASGLGLIAVMTLFLANASPYVTIKEAKETKRTSVHLAGDIMKETLDFLPTQGFVRFVIKDQNKDTIPVIYRGAPPANMGDATQAVAIGSIKRGVFEADKILLKCPSKYESETAPAPGTGKA